MQYTCSLNRQQSEQHCSRACGQAFAEDQTEHAHQLKHALRAREAASMPCHMSLPVSSCSSCIGATLLRLIERRNPSRDPDPLLCLRGPIPSSMELCLRGEAPACDTRRLPCPCPVLRPSSTACIRSLRSHYLLLSKEYHLGTWACTWACRLNAMGLYADLSLLHA